MVHDRPLPTLTPDSAPYWESTRQHALRLQRCSSCAQYRFYPTPVCGNCGSLEATWQRVQGSGEVYSFTVVHKPAAPAFSRASPVVLLLVSLTEGPTMMGNLIGSDSGLRIGANVVLGYTDLNETITLPGFSIVEESRTPKAATSP